MIRRKFLERCIYASIAMAVLCVLPNAAFGVAYWSVDYDIVHPNGSGTHPVDFDTLKDLVRPSYTSSSGEIGPSGVAIAPRWMLTARHNIFESDGSYSGRAFSQKLGSPPNYTNGANDIYEAPNGLDMVLIFLKYRPLSEPFVRMLDRNADEIVGQRIVRGGFGQTSIWNDTDPPVGHTTTGPHVLRWGQNRIGDSSTSNSLIDAFDSPTTSSDYLKYEARGVSGDSGTGLYTRDGWDWKLAAIAQGPTQSVALSKEVVTWIEDTIEQVDSGGLPAYSQTSRPAPTNTWQLASSGSWGNAANWSNGIPEFSQSRADVVEIASAFGATVDGIAAAKDIYVASSSTNSLLVMNSGADVTVDSLFLGGESDEQGSLLLQGGTISTESTYVGYRGGGSVINQSNSQQSSSTQHTTTQLVIGKDNASQPNLVPTPEYQLLGKSSLSQASVLVAEHVVIGEQVGSQGILRIGGQAFAFAQLGRVIVGDKGDGEVLQSTGFVTADSIELGANGGTGSYEMSGGSLDAGELTVGAGSTFEYLSGTVAVSDVVKLKGNLDLEDVVFDAGRIEVESGSEIDFKNTPSTLKIGITADLSEAIISNASQATLDIDNGKFVVLDEATADAIDAIGGFTAKQGGVRITTSKSAVHRAGADFTVNSGETIDTSATIEDRVVVASGGELLGGDGGVNAIDGPLTLRNGIESDSGATVDIGKNGLVYVRANQPDSTIDATMNDFKFGGVEIESGGLLKAEGRLVKAVDGPASVTAVNIFGGTLVVGDAYSDDTLVLSSGYTDPITSLEHGSALNLSSPNARLEVDLFDDGGVLVSDKVKAAAVLLTGQNANGVLSIVTAASEVLDLSRGDVTTLIELMPSVAFNGNEGPLGKFGTVEYADATLSKFLDPDDDLGTKDGRLVAVVYKDALPAGAVLTECDGVCAFIALPGDVDLDGEVDFADFTIMSNSMSMSGPMTWVDGDMNGDGVVDMMDSDILSGYFGEIAAYGGGTASSLASVPEPASLLLLVFGMGAVAVRRRR